MCRYCTTGIQKKPQAHGRTDGRTDGRIDGQTDRQTQIEGQTDRRTDKETGIGTNEDGQTDFPYRFYGLISPILMLAIKGCG